MEIVRFWIIQIFFVIYLVQLFSQFTIIGMRVVPARGIPASGSKKWRAILKVQPYRKVATEDPV